MSVVKSEQVPLIVDFGTLANKERDYQIIVRGLLQLLQQLGFRGARHYSCAHNRATADQQLVLTDQVGPDLRVPLGYRIDFKESTLGRQIDQHRPAAGSSRTCKSTFVHDFGFGQDSAWVDVPIRVGGELLGMFAADWIGQEADLTTADIAYLSGIGSVCGSSLQNYIVETATSLEQKLATSIEATDSVEAALAQFAKSIANELDFGAVAIFKFKWWSGGLEKIADEFHVAFSSPTTPTLFPESYHVNDSVLTALAWLQDQARFTVDFESLLKNNGHEINRQSFDRHNAILGGITSVLYAKFEATDPEFMIRIMNRRRRGEPINNIHRLVLKRLADSTGSLLEKRKQLRRLKDIRQIAQQLPINVTKPASIIKYSLNTLIRDGYSTDAVVMLHDSSSTSPSSIAFDFLPSSFRSGSGRDRSLNSAWIDEAAITRLGMIDEITAIAIASAPELKSSALFAWFESKSYKSLIVVPLKTGDLKGFLLLPFAEIVLTKTVGSLNRGVDAEHLKSIGSLIASCVEGREAHVTAEGSRRFIGRIGHEIRTPAVEISQTAVEAIAEIEGWARQIKGGGVKFIDLKEIDKLLESIIPYKLSLDRTGGQIERLMELARLTALPESGHIELNMREFDVFELLREVRDSLSRSRELISYNQNGVGTLCEIIFNDACKNLGKIVGDEDYLRIVLSNLIRNAAKYSQPRSPGKKPKISIFGQPQSHAIILQIENWGLGIRDDEFDVIFKPFVRGTVHDNRKSISGLGVGLYLSRLLMTAHRGQIFCHHSSPTLDDKARTAAFEGFETCFELRMPRDLSKGIFIYNFDGGRQ